MEPKIINAWWTSSLHPSVCVGFVLVEGADKKRKLYCGSYEGANMDDDIKTILKRWGAPVHEPVLSHMLKELRETGKY